MLVLVDRFLNPESFYAGKAPLGPDSHQDTLTHLVVLCQYLIVALDMHLVHNFYGVLDTAMKYPQFTNLHT